jgi:hypothetical protein
VTVAAPARPRGRTWELSVLREAPVASCDHSWTQGGGGATKGVLPYLPTPPVRRGCESKVTS